MNSIACNRICFFPFYKYLYNHIVISQFNAFIRSMKYFLFCLKLILCVNCMSFVSYAQHRNEGNIFLSYSDFTTGTAATPKTSGDKRIFIARLIKEDLAANKKSISFTVLRQLSDTIFIIEVIDPAQNLFIFPFLPANNNWKLPPALLKELSAYKQKLPAIFLVSVENNESFQKWSAANNIGFAKTTASNTFTIKINTVNELEKLILSAPVNYISRFNTQPHQELQINSLDLSTNKINLLHSKLPALSGNGLVVCIKENKPDTADIDFAGRFISNPLSSAVTDPHASIMATMAAGAGNSWYLGRGVADGAGITSSSFSNLLPDPAANYQQYNITVQNHSYGVGIENFYGADAAAYDAAAIANDKLLFVFSAGNSGTTTITIGRYAGISKVANLTGSFKMAKNIITVGAIDSFYNVADLSSKGPAYDGRIKPEMVAYGQDGSSGAAALVSGTAIILQEAYKNNNAGVLPPSSLIKAVLLNSCDDVASPGIDFKSGFGSLNAYRAAQEINMQRYFTGSVSNGSVQNYTLPVPANIKKLKLTLVWNDLPAAANAFTALKNDLDIRVTTPASQVFLPWVLNSFPHIDSLNLLPVRKRDSLNNIEQITIEDPAAGNYDVNVSGFFVQGAAQPFSIAYQFDSANTFFWHFPAAADNIFPAAYNLLRWGSSFGNSAASMDYSVDKGITWLPIPTSINLSAGYTKWIAPDTNTTALLRMNIGVTHFVSDTFTISARPNIHVGFNCPDSVLLYWNKNNGITKYQLYGLGNKYLEPIVAVADTQYIFKKTSLPYTSFAVSALFADKAGVKSYTLNYNTQGTACYVNNLTADLKNNNGFIQLSLGTTYLVKKIIFQKLSGSNFITLSEVNIINGTGYNTTDVNLHTGYNTYRVAVYLTNGKILYSSIEQIFYQGNNDVIIFPNPVVAGSMLHLNFRLLNNQVVTLADAAGRMVYKGKASATSFSFPARFGAGLYLLKVFDPETNAVVVYKIIIR